MSERQRYFIIEHPTRGILKDLEETDSGRVGRFSESANRDDIEKIMCFFTITEAEEARARISDREIREGCDIRSSRSRGPGLYDAWPVVA